MRAKQHPSPVHMYMYKGVETLYGNNLACIKMHGGMVRAQKIITRIHLAVLYNLSLNIPFFGDKLPLKLEIYTCMSTA